MARRVATRAMLPVLLGMLVSLQLQAASLGAPLSVTVYNDIPAHYEVLAGAVATARSHLGARPRVVWAKQVRKAIVNESTGQPLQYPPPFGLVDWVDGSTGDGATGGGESKGGSNWTLVQLMPPTKRASLREQLRPHLTWGPVDVLICVSPELDRERACAVVAELLSARLVVGLLHRADMVTRNSPWLQPDNNPAPLLPLTLTPHVAAAANNRLMGMAAVEWGTLVAPYSPTRQQPCASRACLTAGFVIQGTLRSWSAKNGKGLIRNYGAVWADMLKQQQEQGKEQQHQGRGQLVNVTVLGRGSYEDLGVPPKLAARVAFHSDLPYPEFWDVVHRSYALVPAFGNMQYLTSRMSSTILASLTTCVPIIMDPRMRAVYSFFREEHVFLQQPGESEVAAMQRVLALPEQALFEKRRAVCALRHELGQRAAAVIRVALQRAGGRV